LGVVVCRVELAQYAVTGRGVGHVSSRGFGMFVCQSQY
jgi:hypothetical protein